jgi:hypothetical protein
MRYIFAKMQGSKSLVRVGLLHPAKYTIAEVIDIANDIERDHEAPVMVVMAGIYDRGQEHITHMRIEYVSEAMLDFLKTEVQIGRRASSESVQHQTTEER